MYLPKSSDLFLEYFEECMDIFGLHSVSCNLIHVVDDVERFGELHGFCVNQFKNELHHIKPLLKQCKKPLVQIVRRLGERSEFQSVNNPSMKFMIEVKYPLTLTPLTFTSIKRI